MATEQNNRIVHVLSKLFIALSVNYQNLDVLSDMFWKFEEFLSYFSFYKLSVSMFVAVLSAKDVDNLQSQVLQSLSNYKWLCLICGVTTIVKVWLGKILLDKITFGAVVLACGMFDFITSEVKNKPIKIGYGTHMACSFFEGYLYYILPNDGAGSDGIVETITKYEADNQAKIPVKKLFLIFTKSLYCPPDLRDLNKDDGPLLEAAGHLEEVRRNVAGVKDRSYKNSVYKIHKENGEKVYLVAECPTPLLTLSKVKARKGLYKMLSDADFDYIVEEFRVTILQLLKDSRECNDRLEIITYDDITKELNLAQVILDRIDELSPKQSRTESALAGGAVGAQGPGASSLAQSMEVGNSAERQPATKKKN